MKNTQQLGLFHMCGQNKHQMVLMWVIEKEFVYILLYIMQNIQILGQVRSEHLELRKTLSSFCEKCTATVSRHYERSELELDARLPHKNRQSPERVEALGLQASESTVHISVCLAKQYQMDASDDKGDDECWQGFLEVSDRYRTNPMEHINHDGTPK